MEVEIEFGHRASLDLGIAHFLKVIVIYYRYHLTVLTHWKYPYARSLFSTKIKRKMRD